MATKTRERDPLIGHDDTASLAEHDVSSLLAEMAATLQQAAASEADQEQAVNKVLHDIEVLPGDTLKRLAQMPAFRRLIEGMAEMEPTTNEGDPPGTIYNRGLSNQAKKPWTERDLRLHIERGEMPLVTVIPSTSQLVFWNGLARYFPADQEITVEKCFVDVYSESRRLKRVGREHAEVLFKKRDPRQMSDQGALTPEGMRARGTGSEGLYGPGAGNISGAAAESFEVEGEGDGGEAA